MVWQIICWYSVYVLYPVQPSKIQIFQLQTFGVKTLHHLGGGLARLARVVRSLVTVAVLSSELCLKSVQLPDWAQQPGHRPHRALGCPGPATTAPSLPRLLSTFPRPPPFPPPSQGTVPHSLTHFFTLQYWIYTHLFNLFPAQDWGRVPPLAAAPTSGLEGFERQAGGEVLLSVSAQTSCSIVLSWTTAVHQQERSQAAAAGRAAASRSSRLQLPAASAAVRWVPGRGSSSSGPPLAYSDTLAQPGLALPAATTTTTTTPRPHTATSSSDEGSPGVLESPAWRAEGIWGLPGKSLVPSSSSDAAVSAVAVGAGRPGRTAAHRTADGLGFLGSWSPGGSKTGSYWSLISSDIVGGVPV